jgi:hypothetical protein
MYACSGTGRALQSRPERRLGAQLFDAERAGDYLTLSTLATVRQSQDDHP